jgi:hypothetical protein
VNDLFLLIVIHIQISNVNCKEVNNWSVDVSLPLVIPLVIVLYCICIVLVCGVSLILIIFDCDDIVTFYSLIFHCWHDSAVCYSVYKMVLN